MMSNLSPPAETGTGEPSAETRRASFATLDGLRGVAALTVIVFHAPAAFVPLYFPSGYLAVDFFFMLSGFVLTFAYQSKLDRGWSTSQFFKTRLARLYPLYLVGLVLGFLVAGLINVIHHKSPGNNLSALGLGLLILPLMSFLPFSGTSAFPLNFPSWSIFFELIINVAHAVFLRRRATKTLIALACISFVSMAAYALKIGTINVGVESPENLFCLFRVTFSYIAGMLLFRLWQHGVTTIKVPPALIALVLLGALALPYRAKERVLQELLLVGLLFPLLILTASTVNPGRRWTRSFTILGQASYAIYILHAPLYTLLSQGWTLMSGRPIGKLAPWFGIAFVIVLLSCGLWIDRVYDMPARAYLRRKFLSTS